MNPQQSKEIRIKALAENRFSSLFYLAPIPNGKYFQKSIFVIVVAHHIILKMNCAIIVVRCGIEFETMSFASGFEK